jgi:arylsulfatase A-like enzyme
MTLSTDMPEEPSIQAVAGWKAGSSYTFEMPQPISRRTVLRATGAMAITAVTRDLFAQASPNSKRPPNLVYVFPDQYRRTAVGAMPDADPVHTPRIDAFAKQGTTFTQACSNYPVCSPHRAMLISGMYPHKNSVTGNVLSPHNYELRDSDVCLTDVLNQAGYDIGYVGKWHLTRPHEPFLPADIAPNSGGIWNEFTPPARRHGIKYWCGYNDFDRHLNPMYWENDAPRDKWIRPHIWEATFDASRAIDFLQNKDGKLRDSTKPFALFVSINPPHTPYNAFPPALKEKFAGKTAEDVLIRGNVPRDSSGKVTHVPSRKSAVNYFAMTGGVDTEFGRILDALDATGQADNTVVVFTSDHGEMMGSHGLMAKNIYYDEAFRVPLIIRHPDVIPAGAMSELPIGTPDITRTLAALLGISTVPPSWQGHDLSAAIKGSKTNWPDGQLYFRNTDGLRGYRTRQFTLAMHGTDPMFPALNPKPLTILFDRQSDPWELANVADQRPDEVHKLTEVMMQELSRIEDRWQPAV